MRGFSKGVFMEQLLGRVHSFESFGTVDGPGVRFVVFLQGCHLRCKYCHNRDSWDVCGGEVYSTSEVMDKIGHYEKYFLPSGGVTFSGGEPLLQARFVLELVRECKKRGYHVAIDTSGMVALSDVVQEIIGLTDLFLLDIKSIREETCLWLSGVSNEKEIAFARFLDAHDKPMWIRQVLVPGVTDTEEDLLALRAFLSSLSCVERVEILPYHDLGKYKWKKLGLEYPLEGTPLPSEEDVLRAKQLLGI